MKNKIMKRYLLIFMMLITLGFASPNESQAQSVQWYKTTAFASKYQMSNGYWTNWSNWESCSISICFNLSTDVITIFSNRTQYYKVIQVGDPYEDSNGYQVMFYCIDGDGDRCTIRLRIEKNTGASQIYVDFANIMWVYVVYRTQ